MKTLRFKLAQLIVVLAIGGVIVLGWSSHPVQALDGSTWTMPYYSGTVSSSGALFTVNNTGTGKGVYSQSTSGHAIYGTSSTGNGVVGDTSSATGYGVAGINYTTSGLNVNPVGVYGTSNHSDGRGVWGYNPNGGSGVYGTSPYLYGISGNGGSAGVWALGSGAGMYASATGSSSTGVTAGGTLAGLYGVGPNNTGYGVWGLSYGGYSIYGQQTGSGLAGYFSGNVTINGSLTATSKSFRIDHPLSPKTKYLVHGCVESNEFKNVYDGTAVVNSDGKVMIVLPKYFQALNEEFRYQLTAIGSACPNLHISKEIAENSFEIGGGEPGVKVCWQVTGVRHDPSAASHPLEVEPEKKGHERNRYLDPKAYGQPLSAGVDADSLAEGQRRARDLEVRTKQAQTWPKAGPVIPRPQANP